MIFDARLGNLTNDRRCRLESRTNHLPGATSHLYKESAAGRAREMRNLNFGTIEKNNRI